MAHIKFSKLILLCSLIIAAIGIHAQGWEHKYPMNHAMDGNEVYLTHDGGYLLTGTTFGPVDDFAKQQIMKVNSTGAVIWSTEYDSLMGFSYSSITQDRGIVKIIVGTGDTANRYSVLRVDSDGTKLWLRTLPGLKVSSMANANIDTTDDGGFICTFTPQGSLGGIAVVRLDGSGQVVWQRSFFDTCRYVGISTIRNSGDGGFLINGFADTSVSGKVIFKVDGNGNFLWQYRPASLWMIHMLLSADGGILLPQIQIDGVTPQRIVKLSQSGSVIWSRVYPSLPDTNVVYGCFLERPDRNIDFIGHFYDNGPAGPVVLYRVDTLGHILRQKVITTANLGSHYLFIGGNPVQSMSITHDGGYIMTGSTGLTDSLGRLVSVQFPFLIKTDSAGVVYSSILSGYVYNDANSNCVYDSAEALITPGFITFTGATDTFTVVTAGGHYAVPLDTVPYTISVAPPSPYWQAQPCNQSSIRLAFGADSILSFGMHATAQGPYISINGHLGLERPCMPGIYTAQYCNYGTTPFTGYIALDVDTLLHIDSASTPWLSHIGSLYTFPDDTVGVMDCHTIEMYYSVACDNDLLHRTACIDAQAIQDTIVNPSPFWDQSNLRMSVAYSPTTDSITFTLLNFGTGGMSGPKGMIVIEDNVILMTIPQQLAAGAQFIQKIKANGATFRASIPQTDFNPYSKFATAAIEAVGRNAQGGVSLQYFTQYPYNGYTSYHYNTCGMIVNSYDPNEKTATPQGAGTDHLIDTNVQMEYTIDFQNTGNDTAYLVRITDTLSSWLDPATIRQTVSSSPCTMELDHHAVVFTFYPIYLPDSGHNQLRSHGFVKYSIKQKPGNPVGTVINNKADIYFDYNSPVTTNTATVRIGQVLVTGIETVYKDKPIQISAYPNPFTTSTMIRVDGETFRDLNLSVYDINGRLVRQLNGSNTNQLILEKSGISTGVYTFDLSGDGKAIGSGKIVAR